MTRLTLNYTEFKSFLSEPLPRFHVDARIAETKDAMAANPSREVSSPVNAFVAFGAKSDQICFSVVTVRASFFHVAIRATYR